jgi:uncharacterized membrane protein
MTTFIDWLAAILVWGTAMGVILGIVIFVWGRLIGDSE